MLTRLEPLCQDLRYALRQLRRSPGFTTIATLTLALGIGVNTSMFSLLNALLLRPLPVPQSDRLAALYRGDRPPCSYLDYVDLRDRAQSFAGLAASLPNESALDAGDSSTVILVEGVAYNYAAVLGTSPSLGRWFAPEDETAAAGQFLAVISYRTWHDRFAGDPLVIGRQVRLESQSYTVIGVAAREFEGIHLPMRTDLWVPLLVYARHNQFASLRVTKRFESGVSVFGRLKPGVALAAAQAEANRIDAQLSAAYPRAEASRAPLRAETPRGVSNPRDRPSVTQLLLLLMSVVGLVLLIACANLANLLLARAAGRSREMATRLALGAGRSRLIRQTLAESLVLALLGAAAGLLAAAWTNRVLERSIAAVPFPIAVSTNLSIDPSVLFFTFAASGLTALLFGLLPALHASQPDLIPALKGGLAAQGRGWRSGLAFRDLHVVAQVALSLLLLITAGLFLRALQHARSLNPGFDTRGLLSARLYIAKPEFTEATGLAFLHRVEEHARTFPAVRHAAFSYASPFLTSSECVAPEQTGSGLPSIRARANVISATYFSTLGVPFLSGRGFVPSDNAQSPPVVVVNEVLAERFWPGQNPVGKRLRTGSGCDKGQGKLAEIVGVVNDARYAAHDSAHAPFVFFPLDQHYIGYLSLLIRTAGDPAGLAPSLRKNLLGPDPRLRVFEVDTVAGAMDKSLWQVRWEASLLAAFGILALLIAAIGLYGVIAFTVKQRTHEIGIRVALGANKLNVVRLVLGDALRLTLFGLALGLAASLALTRLLTGFLYGLNPTDAITFTASVGLWLAIALIAGYVPARRAACTDPLVSLRYE